MRVKNFTAKLFFLYYFYPMLISMTKVLIFVVKRSYADATVIIWPIHQKNINMLLIVFLVKTSCADATDIIGPIPQNNIFFFDIKIKSKKNISILWLGIVNCTNRVIHPSRRQCQSKTHKAWLFISLGANALAKHTIKCTYHSTFSRIRDSELC